MHDGADRLRREAFSPERGQQLIRHLNVVPIMVLGECHKADEATDRSVTNRPLSRVYAAK